MAQVNSLSKKQLEEKVQSLESELDALKQSKNRQGKGFFRTLSIWLLTFICALSLNLSVAAGWLKRNVVNSDIWTAKTVAIMQNEDVKKEISNQVTEEIFQATDAEAAIKEFVPPRASALAVPLTQNLKSYTNEQIYKVLSSQRFQDYWRDLNKSAHTGIINSLENGGKKPENGNYVMYIDNDKLVLDLKPVVTRIKGDLSASGLSFVDRFNTDRVNKTITLTEIESLPTLLYAFNVLNKGVAVLIIIAFASGAGAIAIAKNKRKSIIALTILTSVLMVLNVQAIYFARAPIVQQVSSSLQSANSAAAVAIFDILTQDLITYNRALVLISLIILIVAVMSGPSKLATYVRARISNLTSKTDNKLLSNLANNATTYISLLAFIFATLIILGLAKNLTLLFALLIVFSLLSFWLISIKE